MPCGWEGNRRSGDALATTINTLSTSRPTSLCADIKHESDSESIFIIQQTNKYQLSLYPTLCCPASRPTRLATTSTNSKAKYRGTTHTHTHTHTDLCVVTVVLGNAHDDRSMIVRRRYIAVSRHERDQHTYPDDRQLPTAGIHCTLTRSSRRHLQRQLGMSVSCEFIHIWVK